MEHSLKSSFEGSSSLLGLYIPDPEYRLQELSVVNAILNVECVFYWQNYSIDKLQSLEHLHNLTRTTSEIHEFKEVEETLQHDHLVLVTIVKLLEVV